jgi:hypothetical protein
MENVIKKFVIQLGDKEVTLTMDQAKKLHESLDELFGSKTVVEYRDVYPRYPWRWINVSPRWDWNGTTMKYLTSSSTIKCKV